MYGAVTTALLFLGATCTATISAHTPCPDDICCNGEHYDYKKYICCEDRLFSRPDNGECCGPRPYNSLKEICCDLRVQKRPNNADCCGRVAYNTKKKKCCKGRVLDIKDMLSKQDIRVVDNARTNYILPYVECCGNGIIPVNAEIICCEGVRQVRPPNSECCERIAYDSLRKMCCAGRIIKKITYIKWYLDRLRKYLSLFGVSLEEYAKKHGLRVDSLLPCLGCCEQRPYIERDDMICCDGKLQMEPPNVECCGEKAIDSVKLICCEGVPQPRPPNAGCCGKKAFDRLRERCCSNATTPITIDVPTTTDQQETSLTTKTQAATTATRTEQSTAVTTGAVTTQARRTTEKQEESTTVEQTEPPTTTTPVTTGPIHDSPCADDLCCKGEPYDYRKYICCGDELLPRPDNGKCCGRRQYNAMKEICCDLQVQPRPPNAKCCEGKAYDSLLQICCNGAIIDKREFQYKYFGRLIQYLALFGVPVEKYISDHVPEKTGLLSCLDCCGQRFYIAIADEICCRGTLFPKPPNAQCCGPEPIDSVEMICCEGVAQSRPPNAACCGREAYDRRRQYCCSREIRDITPDDTTDFKPTTFCPKELCCDGKRYDVQEFLCCEDTLIPRPDNGKCCGRQPYDALKEICCDLKVQPRLPNAKCCGVEPYDSMIQTCCKGEITDRKKFNEIYLQKLREYLDAMGVNIEWYLKKYNVDPLRLMTCLDCCGEKVYFKTDDRICCDGELQARPPNAECCGPEPIDSVEMICCQGVPQPRPPNAACCGQRAYDWLTQYCCSGVIGGAPK